jgi:hypothetical protein
MPQIEIPQEWREAVCAILATEATGLQILWTDDADTEFQRSFFNAWTNQVYAAFAGYLSGSRPTGCPVKMKKPVGETYEFLFTFRSKRTYGKILLFPCHQKVMIFSAHLPEKQKLSCE